MINCDLKYARFSWCGVPCIQCKENSNTQVTMNNQIIKEQQWKEKKKGMTIIRYANGSCQCKWEVQGRHFWSLE